MAEPGFWLDQEKANATAKRFGALKNEIEEWTSLRDDVELVEMMAGEGGAADLTNKLEDAQKRYDALELLLLFTGPYDQANAIVSIHAGAGGVDAQDWSEMLLRMFMRFCEQQDWSVTLVDESRGGEAGIKSATFRVEGARVYGHLKNEAGVHRLVRQSPFNADGLRQTSFALVDVIPELEHDEDVDLNMSDVRVDTFMSSGKGGQSVNTTYSAVRLVHEPTGITVSCQNERSQTQNKETALKILRGKLLQRKLEEQSQELQSIRGEVTSAEWGSQIRSYVLHPYKMVKDHRTGHETSDTDAVLGGDLMPFIDARLRNKTTK